MEQRAQGAVVIDYEVKGSLFRGLVAVLREDGKLAQIEAAVPAATAALLRTPPTSGAWVRGERMCDVQRALFDLFGERAGTAICRRSIAVEIGPFSRSITDGILRLFGATPEAMFSRLSMFDALATKNVKTTWSRQSEQGGEIRLRYPGSRNLPDCVALYTVGTMSATFDLFRAQGVVRFKGWGDDQRNEAVFEVRW